MTGALSMSILTTLALPAHLAREGLDLGRDGLAGLAPVGGELDEDRQLAPEHLALEVALGHVGNGRPLTTARRRPAPFRSHAPRIHRESS